MAFDAAETNERIDAGTSAVALLGSSCQAVIEAEIAEVSSPWYAKLDAELGAAENLVLGWRQGGFLRFQTDVLQAVATAAGGFTSGQPAIDAAFERLEQDFSPAGRDALVAQVAALAPPVAAIVARIDGYLAALGQFEAQMGAADQAMRTTIGQVQAQEAQIQAEIAAVNAQVASLQAQVQTDRAAIAKARSERTNGIVETIFGVVFAPFTGGVSLVLAGIGAASIAEAQDKVDAMQSQIAGYQQAITGDQTNLADDERVVVTLGALAVSTGMVLADLDGIAGALDALRTDWTIFDGEFAGVIAKLGAATSAAEVIVGQAWFDAACAQWALVAGHVADLLAAAVTTNRVQVG